ncbi:MAG: lamin tail domain-containing protein [Candidatus Pacebacteria bacterium]|nr:lamin tail domain-containing protein [Candidatus Paceibacterota bacterium]
MRGIILLIIFLPVFVNADIYITEIAWMGDSSSYNNEWIEIYNDGSSSVDLSGWSMEASDGSPSFSLFGSIGAGQYKVFDRASGDYSGALSNSGETLKLIKGTSVIDTVTGGDNWENIGGDNNTKETPQLTSSGWITSSPTKGYGDSLGTVSTETTSVDDDSSTGREEYRVIASIEVSQNNIITGMPVTFTGTRNMDEVSGIAFRWNFGDGSMGRGPIIDHVYTEPGTYVVSLKSSRLGKEEKDSISIEVQDSNIDIVSIKVGTDGYVEIENKNNIQADISGWMIKNTSDRFVFPSGSYIAPKSKIRIPYYNLHLESVTHLTLVDIRGHVVAIYPKKQERVVQPVSYSPEKPIVEVTEREVGVENLASAGFSTDTPPRGLWFWLSILMLIIMAPSVAVFWMNKTSNKVEPVDDIEILR